MQKGKNIIIIALIIIGITISVLGVSFLFTNKPKQQYDKMICRSDYGNITVVYENNKIIEYQTEDLKDDDILPKEYVEKVGIDEFLKSFSDWFYLKKKGTCTIDGTIIEVENISQEGEKLVGNEVYGYIMIPREWEEKHIENGIKYSSGKYSITIKILENNGKSISEQASDYLNSMIDNKKIERLTGVEIVIGKTKEYQADQIYMYYPETDSYLATYWFKTEDGKFRYMELEGPTEEEGKKITDFFSIPDSFQLK